MSERKAACEFAWALTNGSSLLVTGYTPDDYSKKTQIFMLMTIISSLHNLSRSLGCALLAASAKESALVVYFVGGEMVLFIAYKILRGDFYYWARISGALSAVISLQTRVAVKVIADFSGCVHFRHPNELGGLAFSLSLVWAQVFPFLALQFHENDDDVVRENITIFLIGSFLLWLLLNIAFFCTIDLSYVNTFFGSQTAPEYACELFLTSEEDLAKFDIAFETRIEYTQKIQYKIRE